MTEFLPLTVILIIVSYSAYLALKNSDNENI